MKHNKLWMILSLLVFGTMMLPVSGCSFQSSSLLRYNISEGVDNLDPQFAEDPHELMVVLNCFEGLFRLDEDGVPVHAAAQSHTLSDDQKTYTFYLRENLCWSDGQPLTADDFVFAFQRLLQSDSPAPSASDFLCIKNAKEVLNGQLSPSQLGVKALDSSTLEITLEEPNLFFTELLATAAAMPCREDFFYESNGRYGLSLDYLLFNGPYKVRTWNNEKYIVLTANETYHTSEALPQYSVYLYTTRSASDNSYLLLNDRVDGAPVTFEDVTALEEASFNITAFQNTVYLLLFQLDNAALRNENIRLGMAYAFNRQLFQPYLEKNLSLTDLLIPTVASIQGEKYRSLSSAVGLAYDAATAQTYFSAGLEELGISKLSKNTLICLDSGPHKVLSGYIQQQWQNDLNLYVNTEALEAKDFYSRLASGDFQMAIVPLTMTQSNPGIFLSQISQYLPSSGDEDDTPDGDFSIADDRNSIQDYCTKAQGASTSREAAMWFSRAESLLLEKGYAIPLYFESNYFAVSSEFQNILFTPYSGGIYFYHTAHTAQS